MEHIAKCSIVLLVLFTVLQDTAHAIVVAGTSPSSTRLFASDPTALFNADILRIASRTSSKQNNVNPIHAANHAERMLVQMLDTYERSERKTAKPNTETFRIVLKAFTNLGNAQWDDHANINSNEFSLTSTDTDAVDKMEQIMVRFDEFSKNQNQGDSDSDKDGALQLTSDILDMMMKAYARCSIQEIPDQSINENTIISAKLPWLQPQSERGSNAERAENVLNYMIQIQGEPTIQSYAYAVQAWSRQQPSAKMFQSKRERKRNRNQQGSESYNGNDVCAKRASKWFPELETRYKMETDGDDSITGNRRRYSRRVLVWAYSDALDAWARSDAKLAPRKANECMRRIEELSGEDVDDVERIKNNRSGSISISGSEEQQGGNEATSTITSTVESKYNNYVYGQEDIKLFDEKDEFVHEQYPILPSDQSYTSAILALSRSRDSGANKRGHQLLNQMLQLYDSGTWFKNRPNLLAFNAMITAYSKSSEPGSADKAEQILNKLEKLYFDPSKPQYNYLKPDVISYNAAITAWSRANEAAAVYNAEEIVNRMNGHFAEVGSKFLDVEPDAYSYNSLINAWIRSGLGATSADNAESILRFMIDKYDEGDHRFLPHQKTFCQIINAWGKCSNGQEFPLKRAMDLLSLMEDMFNEGASGLKPDVITYSSLIGIISKSRLPRGSEMAMELINKMEDMYLNGDRSMKPNVRSYSSLLLTLARSEQANKHMLAQKILQRMSELGVEPNSYIYNYAIDCAANLDQMESDAKKIEAFKVALNAFQSLRKSSQPTDSFTYAFFLKACVNLMEPSPMRSKIVSRTFQECIKEGQVSNEVISRLTRCLEPSDVRALLDCKKGDMRGISTHDLDPRWSQNTRKR